MGNCANTTCSWLGCSCRNKEGDDKRSVGLVDKGRSCTDVLWFLAFLAVTGLTWSIWWTNLGADPTKLTRATDYLGETCPDARPVAYWPDLNPLKIKDSPPTWNFKVCVENCDVTLPTLKRPLGYESANIWGLCVPKVDFSSEDLGNGTSKAAKAMGELESALPIIGASVGIAILFAFVYSYSLRCMASVLVWGSILATAVGGGFCGWALLERAKTLGDASSSLTEDRTANMALGWTMVGLTGLFILMVCCLRARIRIAIEVVKSASRAIGDMPLILLWPIFPMIFSVAAMFLWIGMTFYFMAAGAVKQVDAPDSITNLSGLIPGTDQKFSSVTTYKEFDWNEDMQRVFALHFFWLLWILQFVSYFAYIVVAGAVCEWYFTLRDDEGKKIVGDDHLQLSKRPIGGSCYRAIRYNLGTLALGSLIIAIVQFVRWVVRYIEARSAKKNNVVQKCMFCCVKCCLWCLECILDRISKNALIFTAIYGDAFCPAAFSSFKLVWRNLARVAAISMVSSYVIVLGKLCVALISTGICGVLLIYVAPYNTKIESPILSLVVIFVLCWVIANFFMTTYNTAVDCIFICFLVDEENNGGADKKMLADDNLKAIVQKYSDESKDMASTMKREEQTVGEDV